MKIEFQETPKTVARPEGPGEAEHKYENSHR
jgi:hypothetical protein